MSSNGFKDGPQGDPASHNLRAIPSVDRIISHPKLKDVRDALPGEIVAEAVRQEVARVRSSVFGGNAAPGISVIAQMSADRAWRLVRTSLGHVINATGVIIHTNLGRAPLSRAAKEAVNQAAAYTNLEYDLEAGERGSRYSHAVGLLRQVTSCEDALVVNNNAAALVLVLSALCQGKEVILSRGQSVEIGGGFRIPDVMRQSGARLVEVGTTNRTYREDYAAAITPETSMLMRVHASNFRIVGFTASASLPELAALAHERGLLMVDDVGSGALLDTTRYGLAPEPMVQESLKAGADLVLFSGDKLLGGPQCGIIVGKEALLVRLKKHPLARALRVDKTTLAALEATLLHYLKEEAEHEIPVWRMISASTESLHQKAQEWAERLSEAGINCELREGRSAVGGGSLPGETLPTWLVVISPSGEEQEAGQMAAQLRKANTPVIARVEHGALLVDPRTVLEGEEEALLAEVIGLYSPPMRSQP